MSDDKFRERRNKVLAFDYWDCKVCGMKIDAGSFVGSNDDKTRILVSHVKKYHGDDPNIDPKLGDENLVLYFKGQYPVDPKKNEKLL